MALVLTTFVLDIAGDSARKRGLVGAWIEWATTTVFALVQNGILVSALWSAILRPPGKEVSGAEVAVIVLYSILGDFLCGRRYARLYREHQEKRKEQTK